MVENEEAPHDHAPDKEDETGSESPAEQRSDADNESDNGELVIVEQDGKTRTYHFSSSDDDQDKEPTTEQPTATKQAAPEESDPDSCLEELIATANAIETEAEKEKEKERGLKFAEEGSEELNEARVSSN